MLIFVLGICNVLDEDTLGRILPRYAICTLGRPTNGTSVIRMKFTLVVVCVFLSSCVSYWHHPAKGQADFDQDHASCEYEVLLERPATNQYDSEVTALVSRCLKLRGWDGPYREDQADKNMSVGPY